MEAEPRFVPLRKLLSLIGLPPDAIEDIIDRIVAWLGDKPAAAASPTQGGYAIRDDFLSKAELSFFRVLKAVVKDDATLCPKVGLGDLFFAKSADARQTRVLTNKIDRKHVDFLLCDPGTARPLLGIELDDRSHDRPERRARDHFVDAVFSSAELPLLRIPAASAYSPADIEIRIVKALDGNRTGTPANVPASIPVSAPQPVTTKVAGAPPNRTCPKCGGAMLLRTASKGANAGRQFWGCSNYPKCRCVVDA